MQASLQSRATCTATRFVNLQAEKPPRSRVSCAAVSAAYPPFHALMPILTAVAGCFQVPIATPSLACTGSQARWLNFCFGGGSGRFAVVAGFVCPARAASFPLWHFRPRVFRQRRKKEPALSPPRRRTPADHGKLPVEKGQCRYQSGWPHHICQLQSVAQKQCPRLKLLATLTQ